MEPRKRINSAVSEEMIDEFEIAKEELYAIFSRYPCRSSIEGCPCCVSDSDKSTLHSKPLRELENEDLSRYAFKAMSTWGDLEDYKHYLPRIFELTAKRALLVDTSVSLNKLEYGKWKDWDDQEQESIRKFLHAWWKYDVNSANSLGLDLLIELHKYLKDMQTMLSHWNVDISTQGFKNYVEFLEYHYYELVEGRGALKALSDEDIGLVKSWAESNFAKLETAFFSYEDVDKDFSERISNILYTIERIK